MNELCYRTLVHPIIEYTSAVWDPFTEDNIRKLEMVQRRAACMVYADYRLTSSVTSMLQQLVIYITGTQSPGKGYHSILDCLQNCGYTNRPTGTNYISKRSQHEVPGSLCKDSFTNDPSSQTPSDSGSAFPSQQSARGKCRLSDFPKIVLDILVAL